jgi:hypothetical protein
MFLSAKESLGCVTNLKRCSDIIKLQLLWYMARERERESSMHEVLEPSDLFGRKGEPSQSLDLENVHKV